VKLSNLSGYPKVHELMYGDKCPPFIPDCLSRVLHKGLDEYAGLKLLEYSSDKGSATIEVNKKILGEGLLFNTPETGGACDLYKNDLGDRGKNLSRNCRIIYFGSTSNCGQFVEGKDDREKVLFGSEKPAKLIIFTPEVVDLPSPKPAPESIPKPAPDEKTPLMSPKEQCRKKGFIPPLGKLPTRIYCAAKYKEERRYCKIITYMRRQTEVCESELIEQPCCRAYDCSLYNLKCPNPSVAPGRTDRDKGRD